jgi:regulation of enolase protein 1 (concanavalin A-like superfamily)
MPSGSLNETFASQTLDPLLSWMNPPPRWRIDGGRSRLVVEPGPQTDFWQRTHYGFQNVNGHVLHAEIESDSIICSQTQSYPVHQYDQAGLMIWFSEDCWLKTSVEFENESLSLLGAVVTNAGFSDWSMQEFVPADGAFSYCLRITRTANDFAVEHAASPGGPWKLIRLAHLSPLHHLPCRAGLYACSPKEAGFRAEFDFLTIEPRR